METIEQVTETPFQFRRRAEKEFQQVLDDNYPGVFKLKILRKEQSLHTDFNDWVETCLDISCEHIGIGKEEIKGRSRKRPIPEFRHMIIAYIYDVKYLHIETYNLKSQLMAIFNRDHAMFSHSIKSHNNFIETEILYRKNYQSLKKHLDTEMI